MNRKERELLNEAIQHTVKALHSYQDLNEEWIQQCIDHRDWVALYGTIVNLCNLQSIMEQLEHITTLKREKTNEII